jgi:catechol 2,3-dioxygenase-like lactoylglutathione lyase family enzyme
MAGMISALDHLDLAVPDLDAAIAGYRLLFGRDGDGPVFATANMALRLVQRPSEGGLRRIAFAVDDALKATRLAANRGLTLDEPTQAHDFAIALVEGQPPAAPAGARGGLTALDHVVIQTAAPERALALYGARAGLDLRLDRTEPRWGTRLMFFRCGDLVVEIMHGLAAGVSDAPDRLWGLSWRSDDLDAAQARLAAAGIDVSEIRTGRKPGTRVFTIRAGTSDVPSLVVGA